MLDFQVRIKEEGQGIPKSRSWKGIKVAGSKSNVNHLRRGDPGCRAVCPGGDRAPDSRLSLQHTVACTSELVEVFTVPKSMPVWSLSELGRSLPASVLENII